MFEDYFLVTGATKGLGLEICKTFLDGGRKCIGTSRGELPNESLASNTNFRHAKLNLAEPSEIHSWVNRLIRESGPPKGVVLNAAMGLGKPLSIFHESEIDQLLTINLQSNLLLMKYLSRAMLLNGGGAFVVISSITSDDGFKNLSVYGATKAGLDSAVRALAKEFSGRGVRFVSVAPGFMETEMTSGYDATQIEKIKRRTLNGGLIRLGDVANVVNFVVSEEGHGLNGVSIPVLNGF
jgi:3-oxoacyl-[acyl-carrier protein] reductase